MLDRYTTAIDPAALFPETVTIDQALGIAVSLARRGPAGGVNPQVGCVILRQIEAGSDNGDTDSVPLVGAGAGAGSEGGNEGGNEVCGAAPIRETSAKADALATPNTLTYRIVAHGWHQGAGTVHAEVAALQYARDHSIDVHGATAVVTLQPCNSTGRTGPCAKALREAGIGAVYYGTADPAATAAASDEYLLSTGVVVTGPLSKLDSIRTDTPPHSPGRRATELVRPWIVAQELRRPYVIAKQATSLDGKIAAPDGTSQWITGPAARNHVHQVRTQIGAIVVGTSTVLIDDPSLTARTCDGTLYPQQPLRVVMGKRDLPASARIGLEPDTTVHIRTHDPHLVLSELFSRGITSVLIEGGSQVTAAFFAAGLVDEIHSYIAPLVLGDASRSATGDTGISTLSAAPRYRLHHVTQLGDDLLVVSRGRATATEEE